MINPNRAPVPEKTIQPPRSPQHVNSVQPTNMALLPSIAIFGRQVKEAAQVSKLTDPTVLVHRTPEECLVEKEKLTSKCDTLTPPLFASHHSPENEPPVVPASLYPKASSSSTVNAPCETVKETSATVQSRSSSRYNASHVPGQPLRSRAEPTTPDSIQSSTIFGNPTPLKVEPLLGDSFNQGEKWSVDKILAFDKARASYHVLWDDGSETWEPTDRFTEGAPLMVNEFWSDMNSNENTTWENHTVVDENDASQNKTTNHEQQGQRKRCRPRKVRNVSQSPKAKSAKIAGGSCG